MSAKFTLDKSDAEEIVVNLVKVALGAIVVYALSFVTTSHVPSNLVAYVPIVTLVLDTVEKWCSGPMSPVTLA